MSDVVHNDPGDPVGPVEPAAGASGDMGADGAPVPISRRDALRILGVVPLVPLVPGAVPGASAWPAGQRVAGAVPVQQPGPFRPKFFTPHEYATVRVLADMVIPADEHSGSATDAKVPEYMDFTMADGPEGRRIAMRGGLAWLDTESRRRYGTAFLGATAAQRGKILDDIAWPKKAPPSLSHGVAFFSLFRDLTASGFFSSEMGHRDLGFIGNIPVMEWKGCGEAANAHALRSGGA